MTIEKAAQTLWDYHLMHQPLQKADCILVLGTWDTRVATYGAQLYLDGFAPLLVFSGGKGRLTEHWQQTEANIFADIAREMGVPEHAIRIEPASTNTGENIIFTRALLETEGFTGKQFIVVQKPYMERRSYATFKKRWPEKEVIATSPPLSFAEYPTEHINRDLTINAMVGDLRRIQEYPALGFQIPQEIPDEVQAAYEYLLAAGYAGS